MKMPQQFCTFHVGDLYLGIEVESIQEVLRECDITPVPTAPEEIRGLINLRGQIVTAVDLRTRFGISEHFEEEPTVLVLDTDSELLSLVVDRAGDVVEVEETAFEEPPDTLTGESRRLIKGTFKLEKALLLVLDVAHALAIGTTGTGDPSR